LLEQVQRRRRGDVGGHSSLRQHSAPDQRRFLVGHEQSFGVDSGYGGERRQPVSTPNVIAKYEFQTGTGLTAFDTSGVDPARISPFRAALPGPAAWGITVGAGGKAQASTSSSRKVQNLIAATGEYTIEAWVAPALVAADKSYMVSYSGGDTVRNFTLGQTNQQYDFLMRSSNSDLNGMAQLQTPIAAMLLQASLQHVVLTYDPINGRQIYVNGVNSGVMDAQKGGNIGNWDSTFAVVLGKRSFRRSLLAGTHQVRRHHDRALTASQITQNFNAGVGQRSICCSTWKRSPACQGLRHDEP